MGDRFHHRALRDPERCLWPMVRVTRRFTLRHIARAAGPEKQHLKLCWIIGLSKTDINRISNRFNRSMDRTDYLIGLLVLIFSIWPYLGYEKEMTWNSRIWYSPRHVKRWILRLPHHQVLSRQVSGVLWHCLLPTFFRRLEVKCGPKRKESF